MFRLNYAFEIYVYFWPLFEWIYYSKNKRKVKSSTLDRRQFDAVFSSKSDKAFCWIV